VGDEEIDAVTRVLRSGQLAAGPEVIAFEREFAELCGVRHAVAVNSGTAALHAALEAAAVGPGDEVITTPFTFAATATPILMQRGTPRFVDIDARTFNADLDRLVASLTPKTKAVIAVDLFGLPIDNAALGELRSRNIAVIEDACQAIGGKRNGVMAGALADAGCFSFYATKNLMTGEGGMLTTDDDAVAEKARRFRQHGQGARYEYISLGYNYRMTDIAAAIGRVQLGRLASTNEKRRNNASLYDRLLGDIPGVTIPFVPLQVEHAYHQYTLRIDPAKTLNGDDRNAVRAKLAERGIGSGIYYPTPLHLNPLFADLGYSKGSLPIAERASAEVLALPVHPGLTAENIEIVANAIREIANG
jgi:dTDP-4-amino-4,6-dideoxygalactose transaminase